MKTELKAKRKYVKSREVNSSVRLAKCGHVSKEGRYFSCEDCTPILPEDDGDLIYFQSEQDSEDFTEEN